MWQSWRKRAKRLAAAWAVIASLWKAVDLLSTSSWLVENARGLASFLARLSHPVLSWTVFGLGVALVVVVYAGDRVYEARRSASHPRGPAEDWTSEPHGTRRQTRSEATEAGETTEWIETKRGRDATVKPPTVEARADIPTPSIEIYPLPPVDPGPDLPDRELTEQETSFLSGPSDRPDEPITAGIDRPHDPVLSQALDRARKAADAIRTLVDEVHLPPLDVLRDSRKSAVWKLQDDQATLGRYMNKLHGHVLVAVDGLRPYAHHDELDRLYRNPRNTGDLRTIASLLDAVADVVTPRP